MNQAALLESQAILTIRYFPGQALRSNGRYNALRACDWADRDEQAKRGRQCGGCHKAEAYLWAHYAHISDRRGSAEHWSDVKLIITQCVSDVTEF